MDLHMYCSVGATMMIERDKKGLYKLKIRGKSSQKTYDLANQYGLKEQNQ